VAGTDTNAIVPPQNLEAEESVLGAMMVSEAAIEPVILDIRLQEDDFYRDRHRKVFKAIIDLREGDGAVDVLTVSEALEQHGQLEVIGGRDVVASLAARVPAAGNARHYARIVKQNALMRRLDAAAKLIQQSVAERDGEPNEMVENAERLLFQVAHEEKAADFKSLEDVLHSEWDRLQLLHENKTALIGTPSGFKELDDKTGGFQKNNLVVIAARPSMGKSAIVCNIAENAALKHDKTVALFSLEMSESELAQRLLASQGRISSDSLRKGTVSKSDWPKVVEANNRLAEAPLWIDDSSDLGLLELRAKARRLAAQEHGAGRELGLIIVDYIQLIRADDPRANRVEQVSQFSRGLKLLSGELGVPVIAVSQLSRAPEQRPDKRPILSDLRESGAIEQDADLVMFLYRDEYYNPESEDQGIAEVHIAKHRNGPIGTVKLVFLARFPKFANMTRQPAESRAPQETPLPEIPDLDDPAAEKG
jgi:replicative DNA helicase